MKKRRLQFSVICLTVMYPAGFGIAVEGNVEYALRLAQARREQFISGQCHYSKIAIAKNTDDPSRVYSNEFIYSFDQERWSEILLTGLKGAVVNKDGLFLGFTIYGRDSEDRDLYGLTIRDSKPKDAEGYNPPIWAGSLWHRLYDQRTLDYLYERRDDIEIADHSGGTISMQIDVPRDDVFKACVSVNPKILTEPSFRLALTIDLSKGGVVPLVESSINKGVLCGRFQNEEFVEYGNGFWLPHRMRWESFFDDGLTTYTQIAVKQYAFVNEPVPDRFFEMPEMPESTRVSDRRSSVPAVDYRLGDNQPLFLHLDKTGVPAVAQQNRRHALWGLSSIALLLTGFIIYRFMWS